MNLLYQISADGVWVVHFFVLFVALFGWLVPWLWPVYIAVLAGTLISTPVLGYCFLSKWEYDLRKKINPALAYDFSFQSYYTYRLTQGYLPNTFVCRVTVVAFVSLSLAVSLYFRYINPIL